MTATRFASKLCVCAWLHLVLWIVKWIGRSEEGLAKPTTLVGFREHIFTGELSSIAEYMALQVSDTEETKLRLAAKTCCS